MVEVKLLGDEVVRVNDLDAKYAYTINRKVFDVGGHDAICMAGNGGSKHMHIARVWQCQ